MSPSDSSHPTVRLPHSNGNLDGDSREENQWKEICESDPARVVQCIQLDPNSDDGREPTDRRMALLAVLEIARGCHNDVDEYATASREVWDALVHAGITEALCENFIASRQPGKKVGLADTPLVTYICANTNLLRI